MNMVRTLAAALLAFALAVPSVRAEEAKDEAKEQVKQEGAGDGEWSTKYGMIFSVQNLFQNNSDAVIGDFSGGVGLQYNLAPQRALRIALGLSRASQPTFTRETTDLTDGSTTETFFAPSDFTSQYEMDLGALYVMRLAPSAIAPYLGLGGGVGYFQSSLKYEDDVSSTLTVETVDNVDRQLSLNAQGVLGVEWRVHKSVALFAEYGLALDVVTYGSSKAESSFSDKATGTLLAGSKSEGSATTFFNFDTGLGQGGQLGLVAFF